MGCAQSQHSPDSPSPVVDDGDDGDDPGAVHRAAAVRAKRLSQANVGQQPGGGDPHNFTGNLEVTGGDGKPESAYAFVASALSKAGQEPGYKKTNQDACFLLRDYLGPSQCLFGCFDGHGPNGHNVSGFVKEKLPAILATNATVADDPAGALRATFLGTDSALGASGVDVSFSGSTGVVTLLQGRKLTCAWVGDSRCVLGRRAAGAGADGPLAALALTEDHKPGSEGERQRIDAAGGRVQQLVNERGQPVGPQRVWLRSAWIPGLAMSRALGDAVAHQVGVVSEPEVRSHDLTADDALMILATDGVWEFIENDEAVRLAWKAGSPEAAARDLVAEAHRRWVTEEDGVVDDITCVVVYWRHPGGVGAPAAATSSL